MADEREDPDPGRAALSHFDEFVHEHEQDVYTYLLRMIGNKEDAADLTQDALLQAFNTWSQVDPGSEGGFLKWTYRIAKNKYIDFRRKKRPRGAEDEELERAEDQKYIAPEDIYENRVTGMAVREAILSLPDNYREVLILRYQSALSYEQISEILGKPLTTVETRIHRAKKLLRKKLKEFE